VSTSLISSGKVWRWWVLRRSSEVPSRRRCNFLRTQQPKFPNRTTSSNKSDYIMAKRKIDGNETLQNRKEAEHESSDEEMDMLDVDFEWFDPQPAVDFHGLKTLCRQLFDLDSELFNLSELVDLILSQPLLGSTVKVDGNQSDPFAFLTVLNLHEHRVGGLRTISNLIYANDVDTG